MILEEGPEPSPETMLLAIGEPKYSAAIPRGFGLRHTDSGSVPFAPVMRVSDGMCPGARSSHRWCLWKRCRLRPRQSR
jgi:hypothetical protein